MNWRGAENLMLSTLSRSAPPAASPTGLIVKSVKLLPNESESVAVATKLFALLAASPFVTR